MTQISQITPATSLSPSLNTPASNALGQKDFLTLLTAQLKNQDPLKPMENTEFLGQMAQFSTVAGIDRLNETLAGQGGGLRDSRPTMATNLLGHSVLVQTPVARPDNDGAIRGAVNLPDAAEALVISYSDATTGAILHTQTMGAQPAGKAAFEWTELPPNIQANRNPVRVTVTASQNGGTRMHDPMVYARVLSASADAGADDVTLQIEGYGALSTLEIEAFR